MGAFVARCAATIPGTGRRTHRCHARFPAAPPRAVAIDRGEGVSSKSQAEPTRSARTDYPVLVPVQTRWMDNDVYGHVNNVVYYAYFDTVVNRYLIERGALDIHRGTVIGLVVSTACDYFAPVAFPQMLTAGIAVTRLGNSSVHYRIGLFAGDDAQPAAQGRFVHVYVDRDTRRPVALATALRHALEPLCVTPAGESGGRTTCA